MQQEESGGECVKRLHKLTIVLRRTAARLEREEDAQLANLKRYCKEHDERAREAGCCEGKMKKENGAAKRQTISYLFARAAGVDFDPARRVWQTGGGFMSDELVVRFMPHWRAFYESVFEVPVDV